MMNTTSHEGQGQEHAAAGPGDGGRNASRAIDEYIAAQAEDARAALRDIRAVIREAAPEAVEKIAYQMPTFWQGENIIHYAAFKKHISVFPGGEATTRFAGRLAGYKTSKGTIQFPLGKPVDYALIADITRWRVEQTAARRGAKARRGGDMKTAATAADDITTAALALKPVTSREDIAALAPLLEAIWREVFPPIIGAAQTEYMLRHYQSPEDISREIAGGARYFVIESGSVPVGYLAYELREDHLFISKIYLAGRARGKGLSTGLFERLEREALKAGTSRLCLHVNRGNEQAIAVYRHRGFQVVGQAVTDIGGGFVMDDYHMEKRLDSNAARPDETT